MAKLFVAQACAGETLVLDVTVSVAVDVVVNVEVWVFVMITEEKEDRAWLVVKHR